jgi:hypothetical protein
MTLQTVVLYDKRVVKFLDEYEWYARALGAARDPDARVTGMPSRRALCRGSG